MRIIPSTFSGDVTTLCHAWKLTRSDGTISGFTDHDRDLSFDGVIFAAGSGLEASEATRELGFAVGGGEVSGALVSAGITEADIAAGLYDNAAIETWLVDWCDVTQRLLSDKASIGEIRRADGAFIAETRSLMHRLDEEKGRLYRATCSADLGDAACKIALSAFSNAGLVMATDGELSLSASGLDAFAADRFTGGKLTFSSGANAGLSFEIRAHRLTSGHAAFDLWRRTPLPIAIGDAFTVSAGCDKRFSTCHAKFANSVNFQGFPHIPGNDFLIRVPLQGEAGLDGGSLFR